MKKKVNWFYPFLLLALMVAIYCFSAQVADDSSLTSGRVCRILAQQFFSGYWDLSSEAQNKVVEGLSFVVRKGAHFSEYFVLGLLVLYAVRRTLRSLMSMALTLCAIWATVPGIDETIQRFVPGRAGMVRDVMIDMGGFGTAVALCLPFLAIGSLIAGPRDRR